MNNTKTCRCCNVEKSLTEFHKKKDCSDGLNTKCKSCRSSEAKFRFNNLTPEQLLVKKQKGSEHYQKNREKVLTRQKDAYLTNPVVKERKTKASTAWRENNRERFAEIQRNCRARNISTIRPRDAACSSARRARQLQATVSWGNPDKISEIYELAALCSETSGIPHQVDHIIPLRGKNVCGFHHEDNLAITSAKYNQAKGNRYVSL